MTKYELKNSDPDDISDLLLEVENSFGFTFDENELADIKTFGALCDCINNKITLENVDDCTNQQAFYKLREALSIALGIDKEIIVPNASIAEMLPKKNRRKLVRQLENYLGFDLNILSPPNWLTLLLLLLFIASLVAVFFNWRFGISGIVSSLFASWIASKTGNQLTIKTVGELAKKMTREHYVNSRRNPKTFNRMEIEKILTEWFSDHLGVEKSALNREAEF